MSVRKRAKPGPKTQREPSELGRRILSACEEIGQAPTSVEAKWKGGSRGYLHRVISGDRGTRMAPEAMWQLAEILHVEAEWLWTGNGPRYKVRPPTEEDVEAVTKKAEQLRKRQRLGHPERSEATGGDRSLPRSERK